ncbi:unnamed protein product [Larinioides sclopetarius]|uniref:Uncharacterized protein n=1 Tax=Larinioides sclopetarius TaxID=280406 RepID=A0AAV1ZKR7_9ARAC
MSDLAAIKKYNDRTIPGLVFLPHIHPKQSRSDLCSRNGSRTWHTPVVIHKS